MKDITEVYPDEYWYDYQPMLESFGHDIVLQVDEDDYQGDSYVLFRDADRYGYLRFGWGSCSGCDALQGSKTIEEVEELRQELFDSIQWGDAASLADRLQDEDVQRCEYSWRVEEWHEFRDKALEILEAAR